MAPQIELRNLHVLEAPDGMGLDAWYAAAADAGRRLLVDRLMNPGDGCRATDGVRSAAVGKSVDAAQPGEHVLADLSGPGGRGPHRASSDEGRLAFYFDGEPTPRLECRPTQTAQSPAGDGRGRESRAYMLCYRKSLKVVLRDAKTGRLPDRLRHVSCRGADESLRGSGERIARRLARRGQVSHAPARLAARCASTTPLPRLTIATN